MKQTVVLFAASALLYSCSPKVSRSVADSSASSSNTNTKIETSSSPALQSGNNPGKVEAATAISPSK